MDAQDYNQSSSIYRLVEELILDAQENLVCIPHRVEDAIRDLELARNISAFSNTVLPEVHRSPYLRDQYYVSNISLNASPAHPKLRRCRKYSGLREIYNTKVEIQRMEIAYMKPKVVYIKRPVIVDPSRRL